LAELNLLEPVNRLLDFEPDPVPPKAAFQVLAEPSQVASVHDHHAVVAIVGQSQPQDPM
jgi:hypothetical protein